MSLLRLDSVHMHYGAHVLLDGVTLDIQRGEKLGLLGRNGAGKTTLLKVIAGETEADDGQRWLRPDTRVARLEQTLPAANTDTVYDIVASGLAETGKLLTQYQHVLEQPDPNLERLAQLQQQLEVADGWRLQQRVETTLSQLGLDASAPMAELSGGWRRRVALAKALVCEPELLLLDEPTNHLDIPAIEWLEEQISSFDAALVLITHDRRFLQNVCNTIAELDRGRLTVWRGDYQGFLSHRDQQLAAEQKANTEFDKKLAEEERWIRQGIKARRTRNEGRVRALVAMRRERAERRDAMGRASFSIDDARASGRIVVEADQISKSFDGVPVLKSVSTIIQRGDRIGIIGPNGAGKSTLVRILLGEMAPDTGSLKLGTGLQIAYSDQLRSNLDPEKDLLDNVCGGRDFIEIGGSRRHAISYLGDFLFSPDRVRTPVKALSGGEQNRAVLASLFSKPANLLVLDEPTNDLDMETLELLEEILLNFQGTVLLVSHDREFMDNTVTSLLVAEGDGRVTEHAGSYSDWEARGHHFQNSGDSHAKPARAQPSEQGHSLPAADPPVAKQRSRKLSYKEQRELESLPQRLEALERRQADLEAQAADPDFYDQDRTITDAALQELVSVQAELEAALERWVELEGE